MTRDIAALAVVLVCACSSPPATGELGRAQFAYCDLDEPQSDALCHASSPLASGAQALLFVRSFDGTTVATLASEDSTVLAVAPSGVAVDLFIVTANGEGSTYLSATDADGNLVERLPIEVLDTAEIRAPNEPVLVTPRGGTVWLPCFASDGRRLVGVGALELSAEGATIDGRASVTGGLAAALEGRPVAGVLGEAVGLQGPVEGGTGRLVATAPSGVTVEVPLEIARAQVESLALTVVETSVDQGRIAAQIEVEAQRLACCEWTVMPADGPISVRRAECDYLLVESTAVGVPTTAEVRCTVLDRYESIDVVVGAE